VLRAFRGEKYFYVASLRENLRLPVSALESASICAHRRMKYGPAFHPLCPPFSENPVNHVNPVESCCYSILSDLCDLLLNVFSEAVRFVFPKKTRKQPSPRPQLTQIKSDRI
jgi:hypothetical protein